MKHKFCLVLWLCACAVLSGCAMSDNYWDDAYSTYGGALERQDRFHGRVGSVFSDPTMQAVEPGGMSEEPTEADLYPEGLVDSPPVQDAQPLD